LVVSTLLEACSCAGLRGSWGSPFAWSVLAGISLLPGASPVSPFPHFATVGVDARIQLRLGSTSRLRSASRRVYSQGNEGIIGGTAEPAFSLLVVARSPSSERERASAGGVLEARGESRPVDVRLPRAPVLGGGEERPHFIEQGQPVHVGEVRARPGSSGVERTLCTCTAADSVS